MMHRNVDGEREVDSHLLALCVHRNKLAVPSMATGDMSWFHHQVLVLLPFFRDVLCNLLTQCVALHIKLGPNSDQAVKAPIWAKHAMCTFRSSPSLTLTKCIHRCGTGTGLENVDALARTRQWNRICERMFLVDSQHAPHASRPCLDCL